MNRAATCFFRSLAAPCAQEQMAHDHGDGRIDQPPARQIQVGDALRLDELDGLARCRCLASIKLLLQSAKSGSSYSFCPARRRQVSRAPEVTPRTAATTCSWLVPS